MAKQTAFAVLGLAAMAAVAWLDYRIFGQMAPALYVMAIVLLAGVLLVGDSAYGSTRWYSFGGLQVQASEVAKLLMIVALARFLADRQARMHELRVFLLSLAMAALPAALVLAEPDMGTAIIFGAIWLGMVLMAGVPMRFVMVLSGVLLSGIPFAALAVMGDYQRERIGLWLNPERRSAGWRL